MFVGFVQLDSLMTAGLLVTDDAGQPTFADAAPTVAVYGPSGPMPNGTGTAIRLDDGGHYAWAVTARAADGYEVGVTYTVFLEWAVLEKRRGQMQTFTVT